MTANQPQNVIIQQYIITVFCGNPLFHQSGRACMKTKANNHLHSREWRWLKTGGEWIMILV